VVRDHTGKRASDSREGKTHTGTEVRNMTLLDELVGLKEGSTYIRFGEARQSTVAIVTESKWAENRKPYSL